MRFPSNYLVWITGLSGSGKTTLGKMLQNSFLTRYSVKTILLDGDEMRQAFNKKEAAYSIEDRKQLSYVYARLGKLLSEQGFCVIVTSISMFEEVRQWNRENNLNYLEVYLKVCEKERCLRDPKKLYALGLDMVELESGYDEPRNPDLVFGEDQILPPEEMVEKIFKKIYEEENVT